MLTSGAAVAVDFTTIKRCYSAGRRSPSLTGLARPLRYDTLPSELVIACSVTDLSWVVVPFSYVYVCRHTGSIASASL